MMGMLTVMADTANSGVIEAVFNSINDNTFDPLLSGITKIMPQLVGVTVTLCGVRKAWSWLRSAIRGA